MRYAIVIELTDTGYSAYAPDLPGCVATGDSVDAVKQAMHEAIRLHLDSLLEDGLAIPQPAAQVDYAIA